MFSCETLICKTETEGIQLTMCDLVKKVDGGKKTILSDVNCTIESNEFVAIVGGSGLPFYWIRQDLTHYFFQYKFSHH